MKLRLLGQIEIDSSSAFSDLEILILSYLASNAKVSRSYLADFVWGHLDNLKNRQKNASEYLLALQSKLGKTLDLSEKGFVSVNLASDVQDFLENIEQQDYQKALELYQGPFLEDVERNRRLTLGEELESWLIENRELFQSKALEALLNWAEQAYRQGNQDLVRSLVLKAFYLPKNISYPLPQDYDRMHTLLLAIEAREAEPIKNEALELFDDLSFASNPGEASERLSNTKGLTRLSFPLIGRKQEIATLKELLLDANLKIITLFGMGGIGKTSLAIYVSNLVKDRFDQVFFVSLEALTKDATQKDLLLSLTQALDAPSQHSDLINALAWHIGHKKVLMILDNFESLKQHSLILSKLLDRCENLRFIVTSREALSLDGEYLLKLSLLSSPEALSFDSYQNNPRQASSIQLFEVFMRTKGTMLQKDNFDLVYGLVKKAKGLPLALKLMSSWLSSFSLEDVESLTAKGDGFSAPDLLDISERHRDIIATFKVSFDLLETTEQRALANLALFKADFSYDAAREVCGVSALSLKRLVEASFLEHDKVQRRYGFHPLVKEFAKTLGSDLGIEERHAEYFLQRLELMSAEGELRTNAVKQLSSELEDISLAWNTSLNTLASETWLTQCRNLRLFLDQANRHALGLGLFQRSLEKSNKASVLSNLAWLQMRMGLSNCEENAQKVLSMNAETLDISASLIILGARAEEKGLYEEALGYFQKDYELHPKQTNLAATALTNMALIETELGQFSKAETHLIEAKNLFYKLKRFDQVVWASYIQALLYEQMESPQDVIRTADQALELADKYSFKHQQQSLCRILAEAYLNLKNLEQAKLYLSRLDKASTGWLKAKYSLIQAKYLNQKRKTSAANAQFIEALIEMYHLQDESGILSLLVEYIYLFPDKDNVPSILNYLRQSIIWNQLTIRNKNRVEHFVPTFIKADGGRFLNLPPLEASLHLITH